MAYIDPAKPLPLCLERPQVSLTGEVNAAMVDKFVRQLREAEEGAGDIAVEMTTLGGNPEMARRLALEVDLARARLDRRLLFLGKTVVYSAGMTFMAAFPVTDRFLAKDAMLLIHCRQFNTTVTLSGPMRGSLPQINALKEQMEVGVRLEQENFRRLIEGSDVAIDELTGKALCNWYLTPEEALQRGLVAAIV
jgi:ATP-dependent protease ClpP protease subunit